MTNEELERAASNLKGLARDLERYDPWSGTRSKSDASDLRLLLSERAELLAAVERMRGALGEALDTMVVQKQRLDRLGISTAELTMAIEDIRAALTTGEATSTEQGERG